VLATVYYEDTEVQNPTVGDVGDCVYADPVRRDACGG